MYEAYQEEDVDKTYPETNIKDISIVRVSTNMPPETATIGVKGLHTRETVENLFVKEEPPADNKVLAKYEYEEEPNVQDGIDVQDVHDVPLQKELPAGNKVVAKYEYEGEHDEQNSINVPDVEDVPGLPPQEELLADNGVLTKYKYSHSGNVMTSQT